MTDEQKAAEIVRISAEFSKGCDLGTPAETCEQCRSEFLAKVATIMANRS